MTSSSLFSPCIVCGEKEEVAYGMCEDCKNTAIKEMITDVQQNKKIKKADRCYLCERDPLFDGCAINLVSFDESGKIIYPYDTEDSIATVLISLCAYHTILSQEGIIAITTENIVISARRLPEFESLTDTGLRLKSKQLRNNKILKEESHLANAILKARKFQTQMDKEAEKYDD